MYLFIFLVPTYYYYFLVKYCNEYTRVAVVRARHGPHRLVASCLPLVTQLEQIPVSLKTLYTGATLMQCNKFLVVSNYLLK